MSIEMLVNVADHGECRIAIVQNGILEELYIERTSLTSHVHNIYKGRVVNIEPGIQAAFIDFGVSKNGFLHITDLHSRCWKGGAGLESMEKIGRRKSVTKRPSIQKSIKKGNEIIVQVTKEGINTKGPTLSTYISLPGRYVVLMPWMEGFGVSQKIEDEDDRKRLRKLFEGFELPKDAGLIIRTAALSATKKELQSDISYLNRLWNAIRKRVEKASAPAEIYQESDLVIRTIRDIFNTRISKIVCDSETVTKRIRDFLGIVQPRLKRRVNYYDGKTPLFHKYKIEPEITKIQSSHVDLKSGGSVVIEQTEALVAIDVNSGKYRKQDNAEQTALKINIEAAKEIVRQLRLRDLGGLIICDFIDMRDSKSRRNVEKVFRDELKKDRARSKALRMSAFGLIELTRQRLRPSLQSSTYLKCPVCDGTGVVKSPESQAIEIIRNLHLASDRKDVRRIELKVSPNEAHYLQNDRRQSITSIETDSNIVITIFSDPDRAEGIWDMFCYNERGSLIKF